MKKLFLFLLCIMILLPVISSKADPPMIGTITQDGSRIALYTQQIVGNTTDFTYYPEDTNELGFDDFYIWISFPPVQNLQHQLINNPFPANITLSMYGAETRLQAIPNNTTGGIDYKNVTEYTHFISSKPFSLFAGQNEKGDPTYGILHIDKNNWDVLAPSDARTKILVAYNDAILTIWHQTDYSKVPITQTRGEFNSQMYFFIGLANTILMVLLFGMMQIFKKSGQNYPPITLSQALVVILLLIILYLYQSLTAGGDQQNVYNLNGLKPEYVIFVLEFFLAIFIPSMFRNTDFGEIHVLSLNAPFNDSELLINKTLTNANLQDIQQLAKGRMRSLYYYTTVRKKRAYTYDKDSFLGFFVDIFLGGVKFDPNNSTRVYLMDDENKNVVGEIFITFDWKESTKGFIPQKYQRYFNLGLLIGNVALIIVTLYLHLDILPGVFIMLISIIVWYINHTMENQGLTIEPMTMTGIAALTNSNAADISQKKANLWLTKYTYLKNQKDNVLTEAVNAAREQMWILATHLFRQVEFGDGLPNLYEILSVTGLEYNSQTKEFAQKEEKEESNQPQEKKES